MIRFFLVALCVVSNSAISKALPTSESAPHLRENTLPVETIYSSRDSRFLTLDEWRRQISPGDVVVLGEQHAVGDSPSERVHHANQMRLLEALGQENRVTLGMEFFDYPKQAVVDHYGLGQIPEAEFLTAIGWGGNAWPLYRDQVRYPYSAGGRTVALNIPRTISGSVARGGPSSIAAEDLKLLPPLWEKGSDQYLQRFREATGGHVSEPKLENYFWAQSLWDETMAWRTSLEQVEGTDQIFVIIAGEFHVEYGLGLPARLTRHGLPSVRTIVQAEVTEWTDASVLEATQADPVYGARAEFIWIYKVPDQP